MKRWIASLTLLLMSACASPERGRAPQLAVLVRAAETPSVVIHDIEAEILVANAELDRPEETSRSPGRSSAATPPRPKIPLEINRNVQKWIRFYSQRDHDRFQRFLDRGAVYKDLVHDILRSHGIPTELYYLAMIESGYMTHARSTAQAVGVWQFIRETGRRYGLNQHPGIDERRDVIRSTEAAAKYLLTLHNIFQSWYLAMAGYNAGEGRILRAIMRGGTRDFWELVEKKALPPETRNYVPKFLAAAIIGRNPKKYGFSESRTSPFSRPSSVEVRGGVRLAAISKATHVPLTELKALNPHLLHDAIPSRYRSYSLWVPPGTETAVTQAQGKLARVEEKMGSSLRRGPASPKKHSIRASVHVVRRGEALGWIAQRYQIPLSRIKRVNRLRTNNIRIGQRLVISTRTR